MEWERERWIREYLNGETVTEICQKHQISRKSVYKWIERYEKWGEEGLKDLSRAPDRHPRAVDPVWQERIAAARQEHQRWGAPKLEWLLKQRHGDVPSVSTIGRILKQQGLSRGRVRRQAARTVTPLSQAHKSNDIWCIDFKGWRRTADGQIFYPLTVTDQATRYILCCQPLPAMRTELVRPVLERVFRQYGLPLRIRSDNGAPFGDGRPGGFTELSVWWTELGIVVERIDPGRPQQNGRHERMHRTLSEDAMTPPAATLRQQQKRLEQFRQEFNDERPHQALGQQPPALFYEASQTPYPRRVPAPVYGLRWVRRKVGSRGQAKWNGTRVFISHALTGRQLGFEPVADAVWRVWFRDQWLGVWDEKRKRLYRPHEMEHDHALRPATPNTPALGTTASAV
jgi:transposase InsO family protein